MIPKTVKLVEVGPRDGLQNEQHQVSTTFKVELIQRLAETGLSVIEAGSFVSPERVPAMADSAAVLQSLAHKDSVHYPVLVPNQHGLLDAVAAGATEVAIFAAASETFSHKNINCSIDESLQRFESLMQLANKENLQVRGYVSCVLGCPYEGDIKPQQVVVVAKRLIELGCYEVSLGDTIGVGTPLQAQQLVHELTKVIPVERLAVHFHNTYGQALANIFAVLQLGVNVIDAAVAGLGGCPYARGATGNVATEDVLYMLDGMNINTGVNLDQLMCVSQFVCQTLSHLPRSKVMLAKR